MEQYRRSIRITLVLLMIACSTQATMVQSTFRKLGKGKSITGRVGAQFEAVSKIHCSSRCLADGECQGYQYQQKDTRRENCILIASACSNWQTFEMDNTSAIYTIGWTTPSGWAGPEPALYQSFDGSGGYTLMQEDHPVPNYNFVASGKMNCAWILNKTEYQWVDLGVHTDVCMIQPENCGEAGGAISFWMNVIDFGGHNGIISSHAAGKTGSLVYLTGYHLGFKVFFSDGTFDVGTYVSSGWTHVVINYIDKVARMFIDGVDDSLFTPRGPGSYSTGDKKIVVGRWFTDKDEKYASVAIDELIFFNNLLSTKEVYLLSSAF